MHCSHTIQVIVVQMSTAINRTDLAANEGIYLLKSVESYFNRATPMHSVEGIPGPPTVDKNVAAKTSQTQH
jgi:hypothetical protein